MHVLSVFKGVSGEELLGRKSWGGGPRPWGPSGFGAHPGGFREAPHKQN